jgi:adenine-specific DNA glycosylase
MARAAPIVDAAVSWYGRSARDLPWRAPGASPWAVLVSEVMLQQTPVARVLPAYQAWLARWPTPTALATDSAGEAVRMWGRLGYPRRALRLHECAVAIRDRFGGRVPREMPDLLTLPGDVRLRSPAAGGGHERAPSDRAGGRRTGGGRPAVGRARSRGRGGATAR